ncbi:probable inactive leucine-rich repeat receptor-like protein kinase at5g20690 [Phtheirospermum japonicum]|uniref:Probable inactive leucine-rich repeat receptor-like protein kinase at5g20690 n=1 Tax=Phtheirospermum japonicum TaxID=374723 RepID=A0A830BPI4_9LAMI|nr:probable inactive leucine-rich repeat receptor-like protein kinase at5g20690 [Phtheirospermum japonicum]
MAVIHIHGSSIFFYVFLLIIPITNSISESEALLKLKESFIDATALDSWKPGTEPCATGNNHWIGVKCDNGVITSLQVRHLGLSGKIDVDALASISGLRSISFISNAFPGPIPDFSPLANLRGLYLSMNQFSGEIPSDYFTKMKGLRKVWLSRNAFSGPIPSSLARVSHLIELHLENNRFSGPIPPLEQKDLVSLNLSNNNLEGEIPSGLSRFGPNAFVGNAGLCGGNLSTACRKPPLSSHQVKIVIWALFASLIVLFVLMTFGIYVLKRRQDQNRDLMDDFEPSITASSDGKKILESGQRGFGSGHRIGSGHRAGKGDIVMMHDDKGMFGLADLMKAAAEVLGNGALGSSYKATMVNGMTVVVKRIKVISKIGKDQFDTEMRKLGGLKHKNVLAPMAYHYRKDEKLLVYEYQPIGSLLLVLHSDRGICHGHLTWPVRLKIIRGIAQGLAYLHTQLSALDLPHGNLKSSNVLLSHDYEPLLSDFGLNPLITPGHAAQALTAYKSPEAVVSHNDVSPKCDVYFLGVVIFEILTGKFPSQYLENGEGGTDVVQLVRSAIAEGNGSNIFDPDIRGNKDCIDEMEQMLRIGADCTEEDRGKRVDVAEAIRRIESVRKDGDRAQDTRTVRFRTMSGGLYGGDESEEVSEKA